ncbi:hypothetical protein COU18_03035 [Candidatus Kaiserbacteria bacterium CG10_big_fil_rev_8_21_14_0_10_51_14]|uniref:N-acetyltransferase domain-containing protein n=1 Tax=Candidatus Kaiserbacteria bacterium CG10_big_fil_rev_8_21_14_0_10_51_14 TaxID=1974610 RepID=A0A2H0UB57_9BACT|nr:MAG: hypothetical protein COU18_03035 [Candidatus Kaiserbacteria bacterium CG10_big_fil_rev_8_21_14_0_10_51_14]
MQRKWEVLAEKLKAEKAYYLPRLTPRNLSARQYAGRAIIRESNENHGDRTISAYAALWRSHDPTWYELGTVWVSAELRGNGFCRNIMTELIALAPADIRLLMFTADVAIMRAAHGLGFFEVGNPSHPSNEPWAIRVGVSARLPGIDNPEGRRLFVR